MARLWILTLTTLFTVCEHGSVLAQYVAFGASSYMYNISADEAVGTVVAHDISATASSASSTLISVSCIQGACDKFGLVARNQDNRQWFGDITVKSILNDSYVSWYDLQLRASSATNSTDQRVRFNVPDIPPIFVSSLTAAMNEITDGKQMILQVQARNRNPADHRTIHYFLTDNTTSSSYFSIDELTGRLSNEKSLTLSDPNCASGYLTFQVTAVREYNSTYVPRNDPQFLKTESVTIWLTAAEVAPVFNQTSFNVFLAEKSAVGTMVPNTAMVIVSNNQVQQAMFSLSLDRYSNVFQVTPTNGSRSVTANIVVANGTLLDGDLGQRIYNFHVIAKNTLTVKQESASVNITITLTDINDHGPVFTKPFYQAMVAEDAVERTSVATVLATDLDFDSIINGNASIHYKLEGSGANTLFQIVGGQIFVAKCAKPGNRPCIDNEYVTSYTLMVVAADQYGEGYIVRVPLYINITNVNDNPPKFVTSDYYATIPENTTSLSLSQQINAVDNDNSRNPSFNPLTFTLNNNMNGLFAINPWNGTISLTHPVRFDDTPSSSGSFNLTVTVSDGKYTNFATVKIDVQPVNLFTPVFTSGSRFNATVPEDYSKDLPIVTVSATDQDSKATPGGKIKYRFDTGSMDAFVVNDMTGVVTVAPAATLDYGAKNEYNIKVLALDQGMPQKTATATLVINVLPKNYNSVLFIPSTIQANVPKNADIGSQVVNISVYKPYQNASIAYSFREPMVGFGADGTPYNLSTAERDWFHVDPTSGLVSVNGNITRNKLVKWQTVVTAIDSVNRQTATGTFVVSINNVNDQPPVFNLPWTPSVPSYTLNYISGQPVGSYVTTMVAREPNNNFIRYKITGSTGSTFDIVPETGVVTTSSVLDYTRNSNVSFVVVAYDDGSPSLSSTATVFVQLSIWNTQAPVFNQSSYSMSIPENSPGGTSVGQVGATDVDLGDFGRIQYQLIDNPNNAFAVDSQTGVITVLPGAILDAEQRRPLILTVSAYDSPNDATQRRYTYTTVTVALADVNDNVPIFGESTYSTVVPSSFTSNQSILNVVARDLDVTSPNNLVSYEIVNSTVPGYFVINNSTGEIINRLPLSTLSGVYNVIIRGSDHGIPVLSSECRVSIRVLGALLPPIWNFPAFDNFVFYVFENEPVGKVVYTAEAESQNLGRMIVYSLVDVSQRKDFVIDPATGDIRINNQLNYAVFNNYMLLLNATDNRNAFSITHLRIYVLPYAIPVFPQYENGSMNCCCIPYEFNVPVTAAFGSNIGRVQATTGDRNVPINYMFTSGSNYFFDLNPSTGWLKVNASTLYGYLNRTFTYTIRADYSGIFAKYLIPGCQCANRSEVYVNIHVTSGSTAPTLSFPSKGYILLLVSGLRVLNGMT